MAKVAGTTIVVISLGATCAGCASTPVQTAGSYANQSASATYHAAGASAYVVKTTGSEIYQGAGRAVKAPLHDLNMMQDQIPPVLLRAEDKPYDMVGLDSCNDVLNKVAELDLSLGPDVDMPKEKKRTRASRGADFAAEAALDAAGSAVEHFIPMRGTIKQISGATRYENHVKHAILSGEVRRSFLKTVGMAHNCSWPAAPLGFEPTQVADASASWNMSGPRLAAVASPTEAVANSVVAAGAAAATVQTASASGSTLPAGSIKTAALQTSPSSKPRRASAIATDNAIAAAPPVTVASYTALSLPPVAAATAAPDPSQAWRPPTGGTVTAISAPVASTVAAPWSNSFAAAAAH